MITVCYILNTYITQSYFNNDSVKLSPKHNVKNSTRQILINSNHLCGVRMRVHWGRLRGWIMTTH